MKNNIAQQRIWIVGASQGIGLELVKIWLKQGHQVLASARQAQQSSALTELKQQYGEQLQCLNVDVSDAQDCAIQAQRAWAAFTGLDMWFYNVGAYQPMTSEEWDWSAFVQMNQSNYLGAVALMLPLQKLFKAQGHGRWIWNASLAAYFGLPYGGGYSAPKAALVNLAEALQPELAVQNIDLQIINHGFVRTRLTEKNEFAMPGLLEPIEAAQQIAHALDRSTAFEIRFPWRLRIVLSLFKWMPYSWSLALTRKMLRS
ncbi:MAG: SDR family NAD(P)-dependent oxidoreductase [Thiopseudomonas sp.]|jgi:short-subunit dehydrogenase|uniref:SDR family NAD(P)-dependent oxidoreductase n=1 Tax=Denitrificimonas caeni TaxID=521720 RepID=UPI00040AED2D|nr:SDR family NAD(P)-dependent oxidoreductase [Denitrificimonas caeni]MBP7188614.1 SDR family NAD(P)-dependent oxidoreductase [Thiopseudomonas sp.]MBP8771384.1 SDR family NAD(P)-dependent oxidoreductase [Thiopseudomonas sp.]HHX06369.1 SDR family NAD(P)-dependent oxidoreductase [Pseudomonas sp.]